MVMYTTVPEQLIIFQDNVSTSYCILSDVNNDICCDKCMVQCNGLCIYVTVLFCTFVHFYNSIVSLWMVFSRISTNLFSLYNIFVAGYIFLFKVTVKLFCL